MNADDVVAECRRWIRYAREDLAQATAILAQAQPVFRHVCWFAQQSAEKALKAALILLGRSFPKTHDLGSLRNLLPGAWSTRRVAADLAALTEWAVEARYPGDWPEVSREDAEDAIAIATCVVDGILADLQAQGFGAE